ncbi:Nif11-like leader peptide family natural product precursor [Rhodopila globiformis]|uniref:Nif11-like leader peptide family natural product n=1 Tax=Rhodopila globiformis TaxID=1071 RepID=A0A2S6NMV4_RHOGL|nr:Nif11-like leader peptide family natural product precursor [Rhodopila globiformis]PPQ37778.1 Nif11-like leader peptide family natural product precursor [Rhodopila globiformis]
MSVESAVAYIRRIRADPAFRKTLNDNSEDEAANWAFIKEQGFAFTVAEFKAAQEVMYKEFGVDPNA